ncbi:hypothetical protein VNO78_32961 [Psophocarpus tetragonolobus]|uniref:Leucine-rich repeat-containing N-terminal plant-type domain-containing protein n=1 Tax=Psophocarpus tetragonolobus TaxID=3891 RepID=A0AAN9RKY0_PSOTE
MNGYFLKLFNALVLLLLPAAGSLLGFNSLPNTAEIKCIETEREALLNFKQGLIDDYDMLSTWKDDENNRDCCKWKGIHCNNETGHVHMLHLRGQYPQRLRGAINITSLVPLQNIQHLDLSYNSFKGNDITELMGSFTHLIYLNLSSSYFGGSIPCELGKLTHLKYLDLSNNIYLHGQIPHQLGNLTHLRYLDLSDTDLQGELPCQLGNLTHLRYLDLGDNHLQGELPCQLGNLTHLRYLDLSYNHLHGELLCQLGNLTHLRYLDLSYNDLHGELPCQLGNLSQLRYLGLRRNSFSDETFLISSTSIMNSSSSLVFLDLSFNLLKSSTIFYWLFNSTTNLRTLYLYGNMLEGSIPDGFGKVMNSLETLDLSGNKLQGDIPSFFGNICTLERLDLSRNKLNGRFSSLFDNSSWCNRHIFKSLDLSYNRITGKLSKTIGILSELEQLYLDANLLEGDVTESHLSNFSKLESLYLSDNSLSLKFVPGWVLPFPLQSLGLRSCKLGPSFPSWLQTQHSIYSLDISDNRINDSIPEWFWNNLRIVHLNMSHNNLIGAIPNLPLKLPYRSSIILNSNHIEGKVPSFLLQARELKLSENILSDWFSFSCDQNIVANLAILDLSKNQIKGQLPDCWKSVDSLLILDLSHNNLSGKIPMSMSTLVNLKVLVLKNNNLMGELASLKNCSNLIMLDVAENMLSGPIPSWIGESMQQLIILNMRRNYFSGNLPNHLCHLKHIQLLDLSWNKLSKGIPTCLKNFTAMSERSINRSDFLNRVYWFNLTYYVVYSFIPGDYTFDITWMWKGVEQVFKNPEYLLKSIDLSNNILTGEIPKEIGYLFGLVSLNLSRNNLTGEIPSEMGSLRSLDFLDLSRNHLTGQIPTSLSEIDGLGKLDLSHNSLSGRIPSGRHFETYEASCFEGNDDLCGEQLNKSCPGDEDQRTVKPAAVNGDDCDCGFYEALYMSLGIGFFTGFWSLLGTILVWRPCRNAYLMFLNRVTHSICVWFQ